MPTFLLAVTIRVTMLRHHQMVCCRIQNVCLYSGFGGQKKEQFSAFLKLLFKLLLLLFPGDNTREQLDQSLFPVQIVSIAACKVKQFQVGISRRSLLKQLQVSFVITDKEAICLHLFYGTENG